MAHEDSNLVPYTNHALPANIVHLTENFYAWEQRGRGWSLWQHPVELEPPFIPFLHFIPPVPSVDDARKPTFLSSLMDSIKESWTGTSSQPVEEIVEDIDFDISPQQFSDYGQLYEFQMVLHADERIDKTISERFILNLSYCVAPISYEIIGLPDAIVVQFACFEPDREHVLQQLHAHFHKALIQEQDNYLFHHWNSLDHGYYVVVDFGLSHEFTRPLRTFPTFDPDPLIGIAGALEYLQPGELGIVQVLFQPVRNPWAQSIIYSVTDWGGKSFFIDAPEMVGLAKQKISAPLYAVILRIAGQSLTPDRTWDMVRSIGGGMSQFTNPNINELIPLTNDGYEHENHLLDVIQRQSCRSGMILNLDELVGLTHLPSHSLISEKLVRQCKHTRPAPEIAKNHDLILGENSHNGVDTPVTLSPTLRLQHMHVIGASGTGKSTFLLHLIAQDLENNQGFAVFDPHGDLIDQIIGYVPENRLQDVILLDPSDIEYPIGFNILSAHSELEKNLIASDLVALFRRFATSWGDQMTSILSNAVLAFLENKQGGTLADLRRFLVDKEFRAAYLQNVHDEEILFYWQKEYPLIGGKSLGSILTRLDTFLRFKLIRNIVSQKKNSLDLSNVMNEGKIVLVKLAQGAIGEENAYLLGALLVSKFHQLALSRQEKAASQRKPFYIYLDEFHHFVTPSMAGILSGARKYGLGLVLAHQDLRQLEGRDMDVASAVLSNPATRVCFRVGDSDARKLAEGFASFESSELSNLGTGEAIVRMERSTYDFNLKTFQLSSIEPDVLKLKSDQIIQHSRERYAVRKSKVEAELAASRPSLHQAQKTDEEQSVVEQEIEKEPENIVKKSEDKLPKSEIDIEKSQKKAKQEISSNKPETTVKAAKPAEMGKGGTEHKYIQNLIKQWAEGLGYKATIESPIQDGKGQVDIALEKEGFAIACEITVTTTNNHELNNVKKCLSAGFDYIILITSNKKRAISLNQFLQENLTEVEKAKVLCLMPEELFLFLEEQEAKLASQTQTVKGYKVKVNYKTISAEEKTAKKQTISKVILQAMKRMKKKDV